ncbi:hypothetical protein [Sphaerisporangium sp. TRM90804]|uniref:DUF6197 family protein n=1 Tax=Sphaerisporangium sp. TRM90804 TaxID=3031113 RepID=UPI00244B4F1C|nr:hypothetical protein [Sphaerisporangium sp. TRM90804]MDH2424850.1 hypothetical protein [Sphaerisporangium sp. TRM90804]
MKTVENLLNAAIPVLERHGRCRGHYELVDGSVDVCGALAVAVGLEPDTWVGLWRATPEEITPVDRVLIEAARTVGRVVAPLAEVDALSVRELVGLLGDWSDRASDAEVFDALTKAAHVAQHTGEDVDR